MNSEGERAMMKQLGHPPDFIDAQGKAWPLGRILKPAEVAEVALFLASEQGPRRSAARSSSSSSSRPARSARRRRQG